MKLEDMKRKHLGAVSFKFGDDAFLSAFKQHLFVWLFFVSLVAGCSNSSPDSTAPSANNSNEGESVTDSNDSIDSSEDSDASGANESGDENTPGDTEEPNPELDPDPDPLVDQISPVDLFSDDMIEPLLADMPPGSPLSVSNYSTFLSAYYRLAGSQLMQSITRTIDAGSIEIRAAIAGEPSRFVAESVAAPASDNSLEATLVCPDGGSVSVALSTEPLDNVELFTQDIYGDYRDQLTYQDCSFDGILYNGTTTEKQSNLGPTGRTASRRFGGFVYAGGSTGANAFTEHPEGFGDSGEQFTVSNSNGVSVVLFSQQSYIFLSSDSEPLQRWHGNWRLEDSDRSMTMERMNISVVKGATGTDEVSTSVSPYFTVNGNVTNGRTITNASQESFYGFEADQSLSFGTQSLTDSEGGVLDLTVEEFQEGNAASGIGLRIDTDGQILNETLPVSDEALLVINTL